MIIEQIRRAVFNEIAVPRFELTKQFLAVHTLVVEEGLPQIERIDICEREQTAEVYFPIAGEEYFFVVYLDLTPEVSVRFMGIEAGSRRRLGKKEHRYPTEGSPDLMKIAALHTRSARARAEPRIRKSPN